MAMVALAGGRYGDLQGFPESVTPGRRNGGCTLDYLQGANPLFQDTFQVQQLRHLHGL